MALGLSIKSWKFQNKIKHFGGNYMDDMKRHREKTDYF